MEFLNDRIGVLLKYGKVLGSLTKRFFYIDNSGNLYYTNDESISNKFLETKNFKDQYLISLIAPISKKINLSDCSVSAIKQYLDDKFNLKGRSHFELFLKTRDYRTILVFSWTEEHINFLRDYFLSISNLNEMNLLNDQFGKYDSSDNALKNALNNHDANDNPNYFEDATRNNIINIDRSLDNSDFNMAKNKEKSTQKIFEFADVSGNQQANNFKNNSNNNFSFKAIPDSSIKEISEVNYLNKQRNTILNQEFKTGLDNLNKKLNTDLNHKDELKDMEDYNSYKSVKNNNDNNNINIFNKAEAIKNKYYQLTFEEKKKVDVLLEKLNGRFVNQIDWDKPCIRLINPSGSEYEYEETWAQMENGSDYSGHVINFMPNGQGKEFRKDGIFYSGEFKNGKWHGQGVITNVDLDTFQGEFINGCICGI